MKPMQWIMVMGAVIGIGAAGGNASAFEWEWKRDTTPQAVEQQRSFPDAQAPQAMAQEEIDAQQAMIKQALECKAEPTCGNGYIKSDIACPNQLPGAIPAKSYPIKSCYVCNLPDKVASIPYNQLCLATGYTVNDGYDGWGFGAYRCTGADNYPTKFIKLCPDNMGAEDIKIDNNNFPKYVIYGYSCRFAAANKTVCNQCGAIAIRDKNNGTIYCVLPSNLPPADANKPCGK